MSMQLPLVSDVAQSYMTVPVAFVQRWMTDSQQKEEEVLQAAAVCSVLSDLVDIYHSSYHNLIKLFNEMIQRPRMVRLATFNSHVALNFVELQCPYRWRYRGCHQIAWTPHQFWILRCIRNSSECHCFTI